MNIPFTLTDSKLDGEFLKGAEARNMVQLKGPCAVGGMRASICNAMWTSLDICRVNPGPRVR